MIELDYESARPDSDGRPEDLQAHRAGYINRFGEYAECPGDDSYTDDVDLYPYTEER